ncbi:MAG: choice-of-anchor F family protein, partial [Gammaproteobacteria bacterium]
MTAAITGTIVFATLSTHAAITEEFAKRIKQNYIFADDMAQWLAEDDVYALNPVNIRAGVHPDHDDPEGGPYDVIYIFPDAATANAWWGPNDPTGMPTTIPDTAVAMVHWELDNGSGSFPGIMSKSDIDGFISRNCIMAAGDVIPVPGGFQIEKTCSNPIGSSKHFKMNVLKANVPIDLVYNVEQHPLTYFNYDTLPTFDGVEESGRIYRALQTWHNSTSMDTATQVREGVRIAGFRLELGYGVGSAFQPIPDAAGTGLEVDKVLGFELRHCMPDHFFDVLREYPGTGTNPCFYEVDSFGQPLRQEIWLEEEYGTFSPIMYSTRDDKRMLGLGIPGGFWDKRPGGVYPPEIQRLGKLDSGYKPSDADVYWDSRIDGALPLPGYYGATTPNYFNILETQAAEAGATTTDDVPSPDPFGYLMYSGVLEDGDTGILPRGIYEDDDGDPATEGRLIAWWDGLQYRWGIDGPVFDGIITPDEAFMPVALADLQEWALSPLQEEPDFDLYPDTGFPPGPLYEIGVTDDLAGLNIDYFVYLGRNYNVTEYPTFTVRMTAVSVDNPDPYGDGTVAPGFPITDGANGNQSPAWVSNPAPPLETFLNGEDPVDVAIEELDVDGRVRVNEREELEVYIENEGPNAASGTVTVAGTDSEGVTVVNLSAEVTDLAAGQSDEIEFYWNAPAYPTVISWVAEVTAAGDTDLSNNTATATTEVVERKRRHRGERDYHTDND